MSERGSCLSGSCVNNQDCTKETPDSYNRFPLLTETPWQGPKNWLTAQARREQEQHHSQTLRVGWKVSFYWLFFFFSFPLNAFKFVGKEMLSLLHKYLRARVCDGVVRCRLLGMVRRYDCVVGQLRGASAWGRDAGCRAGAGRGSAVVGSVRLNPAGGKALQELNPASEAQGGTIYPPQLLVHLCNPHGDRQRALLVQERGHCRITEWFELEGP